MTLRVWGPRTSASWHLTLTARTGSLAPGGYVDIVRLQNTTLCTGGYAFIHEIAFTDGVLTRLAADFEVPCGSTSTLVTGAIRYRSTLGSLLPFNGAYPVRALRVTSTLGGYVRGDSIDCGDGGRISCNARYGDAAVVSLRQPPRPGMTSSPGRAAAPATIRWRRLPSIERNSATPFSRRVPEAPRRRTRCSERERS